MTIYRLENIWALFYLLIPLSCLILFLLSKFFFKKGVKISGISNFKNNISIKIIGYYFTIASILFGLFIIAFSLTKPQYGIKKEKIVSKGVDIIISLDTSFSMLVKDFLKQSRISGAKDILISFIDKRKGDRIGLVTFAANSILKCPATLNYELLKKIIARIYIDNRQEKSQRTAIGLGLASAINRLNNVQSEDENIEKIIILVTDGENNSGEISPETATAMAKQLNIKVYTIGIGNDQEIDIDLLKHISSETKGHFFHAQTSGELGSIFNEIDKLEKHEIETYEYARYNNIGYKFAFIGIFFLLLGLILNITIFKRLV